MTLLLDENIEFIFVYKNKYNPIEDYLASFRIKKQIIEYDDFKSKWELYVNNKNYIIIFTHMWFYPEDVYRNVNNILFLNVEHLTENTRMKHIFNIMKYDIPIIDYSEVNIKCIKHYASINNIELKVPLYYLPYQYNIEEQISLEKKNALYEYDIGIINALPIIDGNIENRRTILWNNLQKTDYKVLNITGWGKDRDEQLNKCKIILNIHNFEFFKIFEHVRCDRLIFSNKLIVSELSLEAHNSDIYNNVIWVEYDNIIPSLKHILENYDYYMQKTYDKLQMKQLLIDRAIQFYKTLLDIRTYVHG
jgi:hypothetical protein